jgi:uncharacterized protein YqgC (DUF456 family)
MEILALTILAIFSLVGFAAIFFTTFGTLIILIGAVLHCALTQFSIISVKTFVILLTLYLCGEVVEYPFVVMGAKKFGASNSAAVGAIIGGIIGAIVGAPILGVGLIVGTFLGIFLGAFIVEFVIQKDLVKSLKAGTGGVLGRIGSVVVKVIIAAAMLYLMFSDIINNQVF